MVQQNALHIKQSLLPLAEQCSTVVMPMVVVCTVYDKIICEKQYWNMLQAYVSLQKKKTLCYKMFPINSFAMSITKV